MPKQAPPAATQETLAGLQALGARLRTRRKALGVNGTAAAEAARLSRVTLHRIEKGEPSVTVGAWANVAGALGLTLDVHEVRANPGTAAPAGRAGWLPVRVALADYPQLKALAWQVHGTDTLTPREALDIYERNARHLDIAAMTERELALWEALRAVFRDGHDPV